MAQFYVGTHPTPKGFGGYTEVLAGAGEQLGRRRVEPAVGANSRVKASADRIDGADVKRVGQNLPWFDEDEMALSP